MSKTIDDYDSAKRARKGNRNNKNSKNSCWSGFFDDSNTVPANERSQTVPTCSHLHSSETLS